MPRRLAFATVAGMLSALGYLFPPLWPCAFLLFLPLLEALRDASPREGLLAGGAFGLATNLGGYHWLLATIQVFGGFPLWLALPFFVILCAWQGAGFALMGWLLARARQGGLPLVVAAPAAVVAAERLWPMLFPFYLGNHMTEFSLLAQSADLGGPLLLSALLTMTGVGLHRALRPPRRLQETAVAALVLGMALGYGHFRLRQVEAVMASAPAIEIGMVQVSMGIFEKDDNPAEGLRRHLEQSEELERAGEPDLIVWPESGYNEFVPEGVEDLRAHIAGDRLHTPLLFGGLRRERGPDGRVRAYNSSFLLDAAGRLAGSYDKTYLLAFGEYLPFGEWFPALYRWSPNSGRFTHGSRLDALPFRSWRLGIIICYEDILPRFVRSLVRASDPDLLINLTNDAWFGDSAEPRIHLDLSRLRAIESRRFLVRSTNSGVSALVDAAGRVTGRTGVFTRENLRGEVRMMKMGTLYQAIGDLLGWLGLAVAGGFAWRGRARARIASGPSREPA